MARRQSPLPVGSVLQLILRGIRPETLVASADDWSSLGMIAERMLFWCGGSILGCRCEGNEMRFALQLAHARVGAIAHHITAAYGRRLRRDRGWRGRVFRSCRIIPLSDEIFLDDLVIWLHRRSESPRRSDKPCYTAEAAYVSPPSLPWINTLPVLRALSASASPAAYRVRQGEPVAAGLFERSVPRPTADSQADMPRAPRPTLEFITGVVASLSNLTVEELRSDSRRRTTARAKAIAAVLASRHGITVAAAARYLNRNRSTLIEIAERYRLQEPHWFEEAGRELVSQWETRG